MFLQKTEEHSLQGVNPGGYYQAVWCRDASYILRDWSLSGNMQGALKQLYFIWSHQIEPGREKLICGMGSPDMRFLSRPANKRKQREFSGVLPTTIYQSGFAEVYGQNPDIDSTALMVSTTSGILVNALRDRIIGKKTHSNAEPVIASGNSSDYVLALMLKLGITDPAKAVHFLIPRMMRAIKYLETRDVDGDGILEQNHNEDWMDTVLRAGKIVYSQACWILALKNLSALLQTIGKQGEARRIGLKTKKAIYAVEKTLWSEDDGCYIDIQESHHLGCRYRTLTQDVSLYLVAVTEDALDANVEREFSVRRQPQNAQEFDVQRAMKALDTLKARLWRKHWPLITEAELKKTGPWILKPHQYHNETFWPWSTGLAMLARSRFGRIQECEFLLSTLMSGHNLRMNTFYEWVNPVNGKGNGAFPFRTGISAVRVAIMEIIGRKKNKAFSRYAVAGAA